MALTPGFELGPHWCEASALTTASSLAPPNLLCVQLQTKGFSEQGSFYCFDCPIILSDQNMFHQ